MHKYHTIVLCIFLVGILIAAVCTSIGVSEEIKCNKQGGQFIGYDCYKLIPIEEYNNGNK